jgi:ferrous iron transport protein B
VSTVLDPHDAARDAAASSGAAPVTGGDAASSTAARLGLQRDAAGTLPRAVLVGNPNVGKSVIFGFLTKRYVTVSNYPGTTVTVTKGKADLDGRAVEVLDSPGINSLVPMSEDEEVTRNILLQAAPGAILQVADAKNLRRALLLSTQLAEMGLPFALDLNMNDEARDLGVSIDRERLEALLGVRVVRTVATRRKGFDELRKALSNQRRSSLRVVYPEVVESAVAAMHDLLPDTHLERRSLALMLLAGDETLHGWLRRRVGDEALARLEAIRRQAETRAREPLSQLVHRHRLQAVDAVVRQVEVRPAERHGSLLHSLGAWSMHPLWGVPVLLLVLWGMYQFVGVFGAGTLVDLLETHVFQNHLSPWAMQAADAVLRFPHQHAIEQGVRLPEYTLTGGLGAAQQVARFFHDFLVGPYGQITMALSYAIALILPIVSTFFLAFGLLEDSGYLPRLAVMVNRLFRLMGLNGKAVLPMVLGLGCDTMATLTTRILETRKERIVVTLLLALGVPCSAQLGVILGMIRSLSLGATLVWAGAVLMTMFVVGWLAARILPGRSGDFILELPPIRRPQAGNLAVKTLARIEWYLREAVPLFLLGTLVLFVADRIRLLGVIERLASPVVVGVLGLPARAAEAFLIGFLRRDYGAAGLYDLSRDGLLSPVQLVVSMVTITLFIPCVANFFIMIKERGAKTALAMTAFIVPMAILVGGALNFGLRALGVTF